MILVKNCMLVAKNQRHYSYLLWFFYLYLKCGKQIVFKMKKFVDLLKASDSAQMHTCSTLLQKIIPVKKRAWLCMPETLHLGDRGKREKSSKPPSHSGYEASLGYRRLLSWKTKDPVQWRIQKYMDFKMKASKLFTLKSGKNLTQA